MNPSLAGRSYLDRYKAEIEPTLQKIDLLIKSGEAISAEAAAELLDLPPSFVSSMCEPGENRLPPRRLISVMEQGASPICGIFRREVSIGSPLTYTKEEIAYVYGLDTREVSRAFFEARILEATAATLPLIFARISGY